MSKQHHPRTTFRRGILVAAWVLVQLCASAGHARAQQRPLVTQDPEAIGAGRILFEAGFDYSLDAVYPASGLTGDLLRVPLLGLSFGVGTIAEIQINGGLYNHLSIATSGPAPLSDMLDLEPDALGTSDVEDIVIGAKVRLAPETESRPALGFRFSTKLPNASNESGLGLDTMDFHASLLFGKTVRQLRMVGNVGLGILSDPTRGDRQNDVFTYGVSLARAVSQHVDLVGEINGRANMRSGEPPVGTESRSALRGGFRVTKGAGRFDGGILIGLTERDPSFGFTAGFTYVFDAFTVQ
jgi:hypothetical protein